MVMLLVVMLVGGDVVMLVGGDVVMLVGGDAAVGDAAVGGDAGWW